MENGLPMSIQELTSGPTAEPVDYAAVYATCLQAAATLVSAAMLTDRPHGKIYNTQDLVTQANVLMVEALVAGKRYWDEGAITLTPEPSRDNPVRKSLHDWTELLEAAEVVVMGVKYGDRTMHRPLDRLKDAVAALREGNPRIDPS